MLRVSGLGFRICVGVLRLMVHVCSFGFRGLGLSRARILNNMAMTAMRMRMVLVMAMSQ